MPVDQAALARAIDTATGLNNKTAKAGQLDRFVWPSINSGEIQFDIVQPQPVEMNIDIDAYEEAHR